MRGGNIGPLNQRLFLAVYHDAAFTFLYTTMNGEGKIVTSSNRFHDRAWGLCHDWYHLVVAWEHNLCLQKGRWVKGSKNLNC